MATVNIFDMVDTWANGATTFTAIKMNVTDTNSASGSLLMDLQVGGVSKFNVRKDGTTYLASGGFEISTTTTAGAATRRLVVSNGLYNISTNDLYWSSSTTDVVPIDLQIGRRAAANLRLGAADAASPVAQTLSVQSVVAGTSNTAGANLTITGSQGTGSGAGGSIIFQVAPAGSSGTAQNALATALTIGSDRSVAFAVGNCSFGAGTTSNYLRFTQSTPVFELTQGEISLVGNAIIAWGNQSNTFSGSTQDLIIRRDAANTLALRNGTNAQTFRVYNTYTDASNYERGNIFWNSNAFEITTTAAGTGTGRALILRGSNSTRVDLLTNGNIAFYGNIIAGADNTYDIGASGANRPRDLFVGGGMTTGAPTGGTAAKWKLGTVATVSPTSPNRTIEVDIGGTIYYIHAKTTND